MVTISVLDTKGYTKQERVKLCYYNRVLRLPFNKLESMLNKDYVYSPFVYANGKRAKENIISKANFVVIDVDDTYLTIFERHLDLQAESINHIIATTSNKDNDYKYRVLLPLSQSVSADDYRSVVNGILVEGLIPDMDIASKKPSQPFFSYKDSDIFHYYDGINLDVQQYAVEEEIVDIDNSNITPDDYSIVVNRYQHPKKGNGRNALVSASFNMIEAGFNKQQLEECLLQINQSWVSPMDINSLYSLIIRPMQRRIKS